MLANGLSTLQNRLVQARRLMILNIFRIGLSPPKPAAHLLDVGVLPRRTSRLAP